MREVLAINGDEESVDDPSEILAFFLRGIGLTGVKVGCETSVCGACTVLVDGEAVKSCTMLVGQAAGCEVTTIEGIGDSAGLTVVQQALIDEHGIQCGFCTPGFVISATALLERTDDPTDDDIIRSLDGNLCRCTGYVGILRAVKRAAAQLRGESPARLAGRSLAQPLSRTEVRHTSGEDLDVEVV